MIFQISYKVVFWYYWVRDLRYNDVTWASWRLTSATIRLVVKQHVKDHNKEKTKLHIDSQFWEEFNGSVMRKSFPCHVAIMRFYLTHYSDVIMMVSQITGVSIVYPTVCPGADETKHPSSASLAFVVREIHRWPVNSPHKGPVTRKKFLFDDVIMM